MSSESLNPDESKFEVDNLLKSGICSLVTKESDSGIYKSHRQNYSLVELVERLFIPFVTGWNGQVPKDALETYLTNARTYGDDDRQSFDPSRCPPQAKWVPNFDGSGLIKSHWLSTDATPFENPKGPWSEQHTDYVPHVHTTWMALQDSYDDQFEVELLFSGGLPDGSGEFLKDDANLVSSSVLCIRPGAALRARVPHFKWLSIFGSNFGDQVLEDTCLYIRVNQLRRIMTFLFYLLTSEPLGNKHNIVVGEAGIGKTTLFNLMALLSARYQRLLVWHLFPLSEVQSDYSLIFHPTLTVDSADSLARDAWTGVLTFANGRVLSNLYARRFPSNTLFWYDTQPFLLGHTPRDEYEQATDHVAIGRIAVMCLSPWLLKFKLHESTKLASLPHCGYPDYIPDSPLYFRPHLFIQSWNPKQLVSVFHHELRGGQIRAIGHALGYTPRAMSRVILELRRAHPDTPTRDIEFSDFEPVVVSIVQSIIDKTLATKGKVEADKLLPAELVNLRPGSLVDPTLIAEYSKLFLRHSQFMPKPNGPFPWKYSIICFRITEYHDLYKSMFSDGEYYRRRLDRDALRMKSIYSC